jgi:tetratricopeptide (TPR) repeat protein
MRLDTLSLEKIKLAAVNEKSSSMRPVGNLSFAANYFFHEYRPAGYHFINILIHSMSALFLYLLIKSTFQTPVLINRYKQADIIAVCASLVWLVNPLHTQSVTYIVQRLNSMAAMLFILSLYLFVKGRLTFLKAAEHHNGDERPDGPKKAAYAFFAGSLCVWMLALGTKQIAATLPFFVFLYEWFFFQDMEKDWMKKQFKIILMVFLIMAVVSFVFLGANPVERVSQLGDFAEKRFALGERLLTQPRVVIYYLGLLFYPHPSRLNLDHDFPLSYSFIDPLSTLISLLVIIGLIASAILIAKKERLLSFCIIWYFGNLIIESSIIPLALIFEHRTYLPSMMISFLIVYLIFRYLKPFWPKMVLFFLVICICGYWTYERNKVYTNGISLWSDCAKKSPHKDRPHYNLGKAYLDLDNTKEAIKYFDMALGINPQYVMALINKGFALARQSDMDGAITLFDRALKEDSNNVEAMTNLGNAKAMLGYIEDAVPLFQKAIKLNPKTTPARINLAKIYRSQDRSRDALKLMAEVLKLEPDNFEALLYMGQHHIFKSSPGAAMAYFKAAEKIQPHDRRLKEFKEKAQNELKAIDQIISDVTKDLKADPDNALILYDLGVLYKNRGNLDQAIEYLDKAVTIQPDFKTALNDLALVYAAKKEYQKSVAVYGKVIKLWPDNPNAYYNTACMFALMNDKPTSIQWLKKAIEKGYVNWDLIKTDLDLENIRSTDEYKEMMKNRK